jgi:hypothetical protein
MIHRFATYVAAGETWINFELADLGKPLGIGYNNGANNPLIRSLERIDRFGFGRLELAKPLLRLRTAIPPISRRLAERIPDYLAATCPYIVR